MKARLIFAGSLAAMGLLVGCETIPPGAERGPHGTMAYNVSIEASDPEARIDVNGEYVGKTPLTLKIWGNPDGRFHDFGSYYYVIQAFPSRTNQFAQTKVYRTGRWFTPDDYIPRKIYFDMNQPAPAYQRELYVGPGYPPGIFWAPEIFFGPPPPIMIHPHFRPR